MSKPPGKHGRILILLAALAGCACAGALGGSAPQPESTVELTLLRGWTVDGPGAFQPSALALKDGTLLTVCDKQSAAIFRIDLEGEGDIAQTAPLVTFTGPDPLPRNGWLDLEALVVAPDGSFYLSSEEANRLLHVPAEGGVAHWITPDLGPAGGLVGLFVRHNAYGEGLALLGPNHFLIAAERNPRGLVEWIGGMEPSRVAVQQMDSSRFPEVMERGFDFSDLCVWRGRVFALARNQHLVVELVRDASGRWTEGPMAWSFHETQGAPEWVCTGARFGLGEGLAIDDDAIYIVVDNNGAVRDAHPEDRRPWLWKFRNPIAR